MVLFLLFFLMLSIMYRKTVMGKLSMIITISALSALVISLDIPINNDKDIYNFIVITIILFFFILGFKNYSILELRDDNKKNKFQKMFRYVFGASIIGVIANLLILAMTLSFFFRGSYSVEVFKNLKIAQQFLINQVPRPLMLASAIFSPFSYLSLGYHFYFMIQRNRKKALKALIGSFSIFLPSLFVLARGGMFLYIMMYLSFWVYSYRAMDIKIINGSKKKNKKKNRRNLIKILAIVAIPFILITKDRFTGYTIKTTDSFVTHPLFYSIFHYFSQWIPNGLKLLGRYTTELSTAASSFRYIPNAIMELFGVESQPIQLLRNEVFGDLSTSFNGLSSILVYDLGYFGAIIFSVFFALLVMKFRPRRGVVKPMHLLYFAVLIPVPLNFFQGLYFINSTYNIGIIYMMIFTMFYKIKIA